MSARRVGARGPSGFSLVELMLALTLGAVLLTSVASMAGSMSRTIAQLQAESTDSYDKAMARMSRDVRYAWWVDVPTRNQLRIADSRNRVTEYYRVGNSLLVRLPTGEEGAVVTGLDMVNFQADMTQRLREAAVRGMSGRIHHVPTPATASGGLKMLPGNSVALAFIAHSDAGEGDVPGVRENITQFLPTRFDLPIAKATLTGSFRVEIYPARAPGDARPLAGAAALTSFDVNFVVLPFATVLVAATNPLDPSTAFYAAPTSHLPIVIPGFAPTLRPGTAYSIVVTILSGSMGVMAGYVNAAGVNPAVQLRTSAAAPWTTLAASVPFSIHGDYTLTASADTDVARGVQIDLLPSAGEQRSSTVVVHSQILADDPWLGVIPGETAP
jgi:prepilin-type N-terminal cleavage/methylation domain-containing protein